MDLFDRTVFKVHFWTLPNLKLWDGGRNANFSWIWKRFWENLGSKLFKEPFRLGLTSAHGETNGIFICNYVMKDVGLCISTKKYKQKIETFPFNQPLMATSVYKVHLNAPWSPGPTVCVNFPHRWQKQWVHKWHQHMVQTLWIVFCHMIDLVQTLIHQSGWQRDLLTKRKILPAIGAWQDFQAVFIVIWPVHVCNWGKLASCNHGNNYMTLKF